MLTATMAEDVRNILAVALPWRKFAGKRILITGTAGFLAGYMLETLLALDDAPAEIIGLVRNLPKAQTRFAHHADRKNFKLVAADLSQPLTLDGKFNFIIHAASKASPKFYFADPMGTAMPNGVGTWHLLERARADRSEGLLFISSGEVYGHTGAASIAESDYGPLDPAALRSCYAESKRLGENLCVSAHYQYDLATYIARPFHTFGPGLALDDGRVFADFLADIAGRRDIAVRSDGSARRAFCYVSDAVAGLFTVFLKGEMARPYNVGNDEACLSIRELAELLAAAFAERGIKAVLEADKAGTNYAKSPFTSNCPDVSALRGLGWAPRVNVIDGFRRTIRAIEKA